MGDDEHNLNDDGDKKENDWNIFVIELNPFYKSAGAGLFDWRSDRELFLNGPCEIRIRNELDPKGIDYFHPSWAKSYEAYIEESDTITYDKNLFKNGKGKGKGKKKSCVIL